MQIYIDVMTNMFEVNASVFERSSDKFLCENNDFNSDIYVQYKRYYTYV